jgi:hypothetical protein
MHIKSATHVRLEWAVSQKSLAAHFFTKFIPLARALPMASLSSSQSTNLLSTIPLNDSKPMDVPVPTTLPTIINITDDDPPSLVYSLLSSIKYVSKKKQISGLYDDPSFWWANKIFDPTLMCNNVTWGVARVAKNPDPLFNFGLITFLAGGEGGSAGPLSKFHNIHSKILFLSTP